MTGDRAAEKGPAEPEPDDLRFAVRLIIVVPMWIAGSASVAALAGQAMHAGLDLQLASPPREFYIAVAALLGTLVVALSVQGAATIGALRDRGSATWLLSAIAFPGIVTGISLGIAGALIGLLGADPWGLSSALAVIALMFALAWTALMPIWANLTRSNAAPIIHWLNQLVGWAQRLQARGEGVSKVRSCNPNTRD